MWPWILGSAALGGLQAYQQSGGDIGKTLGGAAIGGGLGALVPGVGRFAGTALEKSGVLAPLASSLTSAATKGRQALGLVGPAGAVTPAQLAKLGGGGAAFLASSAIPGIASTLSGAPGAAVAKAGGGGAGLIYSGMQPGAADYNAGAAVPGGLPVGAQPYNAANVLDPSGQLSAARINQLMQGDVELANMRKLLPELYKASEARSKSEFSRQMAAAGIRQNIATAAQMLMQSQTGAQQMGLNAAQQAGQALTQQYQYS